ncbi:MAG: ABC transporter ATP-binding protein [Acutalibacteraceae bacterium]
MSIVKVENLTKVYGKDNAQVVALDHVSFEVPKGQFLAIVGPSGSGKSTLLYLLGGVDRPTSGRVLIDGEDIYALNESSLAVFRRRQIGLIYQFYNLLPVLNVEENITLPLLLDGQKPDQAQLQQMVATLGLSNRLRHLPNQLSGGQQQCVSIGRALIANPAIVLADEPTGNLDSKNSQEILDLLKLSNKIYQQTVIIITHDPSIALKADRILRIEDGRIVSDEVTGA